MDNIIGPPVTGDNFFGREKEIGYAWGRIKAGNNIILPSPRRVGKTSFALKLLEIAEREGWSVISMNLEEVSTEQDFISLFIEQLRDLSWWQKVKEKGGSFIEFLKQFKPSVTYGEATFEVEWRSHKENIYKQLADLLDHSEPTLIFFDEVTVLLNSILKADLDGKKNVTEFLHWLREIRILPDSKIRWIYCSSVGIENFTHRYGISDTINDIHDYKLKAYTTEESIGMLRNLSDSNNLPLSIEVLNAIIDKLEYCLPFFLQLMFEKINYLVCVENEDVNNNIVDLAYKALIEERHFNTWIERISEQYNSDEKYAFILLKHICQIKEGVNRVSLINVLAMSDLGAEKAEDMVSRLLYMLKNDGYLIDDNELYHFRSPLLRDFWFNRFVK